MLRGELPLNITESNSFVFVGSNPISLTEKGGKVAIHLKEVEGIMKG